jgi:hypothetical protein
VHLTHSHKAIELHAQRMRKIPPARWIVGAGTFERQLARAEAVARNIGQRTAA